MSVAQPKVSVCVVTYNQEKYIRQCIQSIVEQITDFPFEIIISDDCSEDKTQAIVSEFAKLYPDKIRVIFHEKNIGAYNNFLFVHKLAEGSYIAHMDGDDYCLPGKLQAQADLLDQDANCNIVWHRMLLESPDGSIHEDALNDIPGIDKRKFQQGDIIQFISIGTNSSKMYRKSIRDFDLPDFNVVDYFANVMQVGTGYARFVSLDTYGVYRIGIGIASNGSKTREILADCFRYFAKNIPSYRLQANTAALGYLLIDLKNRRPTWKIFLHAWIDTFHFGSPFNLILNLRFMRKLNLKVKKIGT